jgi:hypothetical protein
LALLGFQNLDSSVSCNGRPSHVKPMTSFSSTIGSWFLSKVPRNKRDRIG